LKTRRRRKDMATKKQEAKNSQPRNTTTPQKDVQKRYQQDFSRYKQQIERISKTVDGPRAA